MKNEIKTLSHSTYRCEYHIVFAPKYRRKAIYGELRADIGAILRKLCDEKKVEIIEANACPRPHTHVGKHTALFKYITICRISQGEKYIDDIR